MATDWIDHRIGDLGRVATGRTPPGTNPEYFGTEIPFLTPTDMDGRRRVGATDRMLSGRGQDILRNVIIPHGVAVSCIGWQMGKAILVDEPVITNQQINSIIPDPSKADDLFLYYVLNAKRDEIFRLGAGGSRTPILNKSGFESFILTLPPLCEQRKIANLLGGFDDKIELNQKMNGTLEAMARALFKSWFVDFDPVRAKAEGRDTGLPAHIANLFPDSFEDSELGEIPMSWRHVPLPEVLEINPQRSIRKGATAPYLDMANMPTAGHTVGEVIERPFGSGMRFINGDTLVARITPCLENGKTAFVDFLEERQVAWGSTEYIVLRPKPPLPEEYAYCLARSPEFRDFAVQSMTGSSGRQRIPAESLSHFMVALPSRPAAEHFGNLVKPLFARISKASRENRALAALRDTLLPKFISGEIRMDGLIGAREEGFSHV